MKRRQRLLKEYELASKVISMSKPYYFIVMGQHQSRINDKWQRFDRGLEVFQRQMWLHGNTGEPIVSSKEHGKQGFTVPENPIPDGNYRLHLRSKEKSDSERYHDRGKPKRVRRARQS